MPKKRRQHPNSTKNLRRGKPKKVELNDTENEDLLELLNDENVDNLELSNDENMELTQYVLQYKHHDKINSCITQIFCRALVQRMFEYCFSDKTITEPDSAQKKLSEIFQHFFPSGRNHTDCKKNGRKWCPTAFPRDNKKTKKNKSSLLSKEYPIQKGLWKKFEKWIFSELLTDDVLLAVLDYGCTSLNESLNAIINRYCDKKRFLGHLSYRGAVARGVLQWNHPYLHLLEEMAEYGMEITPQHQNFVKRLIKTRTENKEWAATHQKQLAHYRKKWKLGQSADSAYVGKGLSAKDGLTVSSKNVERIRSNDSNRNN